MYKIEQIADWFIARSRADVKMDDYAEPISKMKLQKLLYFTQGTNLAVNGERLFDSPLYAFQHGPVTSEIQHKYADKDLPEFSNDVSDVREVELADNYDQISKDEKASEVLNFVWDEYSPYTASTLRRISHDANGPWAKVYNSKESWIKMSDQDIETYFKEHVVECH